MRRRLALSAGLVLAVAVIAAAGIAYLLGRSEPPRAIDADLARLGSTDGLYTAPQIKAQAGYSLSQTAYAYAALAALGDTNRSALSAATLARLKPAPDDDAVAEAWYRGLLGGAGLAVKPPTAAQLGKLWVTAGAAEEPEVRVQEFAQLGELGRDVPPVRRAHVLATVTATAASTDPGVQRARAQLFAQLGRTPDAAVQRVAGQAPPTDGDAPARVDAASAIAISAAVLGHPPSDATRRTLLDGARAARDPASVFLALRALQTAQVPTTELDPLAGDLRRTLGARGAILEEAVFPMIPKAVWLVAHIREQAGETALPEDRTVALSQALIGPDWRDDPDSYGVLMAAAQLAGLSYEGGGMMPVPVPPRTVRNPPDAATWIIRGRVAADLGKAPAAVTVRAWPLSGEAELGAVGGLLQAAHETGTQVRMPPAFQQRFIRLATTETFHEPRWALGAAAGLNRLGRRAAADALVKRYAKVGCPGYPHLVSDGATCDLEATLLALELRNDLPAAGRLTAEALAQ